MTRAPPRLPTSTASRTPRVRPECEKATIRSSSPRRLGHRHHVRVVERRAADPDAQELVSHVARELGGSAQPIEVPLPTGSDQAHRSLERLQVQDGEGLLEGLDGGAEHLAHDGVRPVGRLHLLVKLHARLRLVLRERRAQFPEAVVAELLRRLHDHRFGGQRLRRDPLQGELVVNRPPQEHLHDASLGGSEVRKHHPDPRTHRARIELLHHAFPRVSRSMSIAMMMMRPVASNW